MALTTHQVPHDSQRGRFRIVGQSGAKQSLADLARDLPPVVYFMRTEDSLIKIGFTRDLAQRKRHFGSGWDHILAVTPGTRDDEKTLLARFAEHLARGQEYFHPAPALVDHINTIRETLGVSPIDGGCARGAATSPV